MRLGDRFLAGEKWTLKYGRWLRPERKGVHKNLLIKERVQEILKAGTKSSKTFSGACMALGSKNSVYFNQMSSKEKDCHLLFKTLKLQNLHKISQLMK